MTTYKRRKQEGLCPMCGGPRPDDSPYIACLTCREKDRGYGAASRPRRRLAGRCRHCGTPALPGLSVCAAHTTGLSPWAAGTSLLLQPLAVRQQAAESVGEAGDKNLFFSL